MGDRSSGEALLRGSRVRLRPPERGDLPRYQELVQEGRRRENHWSRGRFRDDIHMRITAEEWLARHGQPRLPDLGPAP